MTRLYRLSGSALEPISRGKLVNENLIEGWIERQPDLLGLDLLVIGRQVVTEFGGRIDLLGIDADGNLVIIELKRDRTPREIIAQVLDYASWVSDLTTRQVHDLATGYLNGQLDTTFRERFGAALPQTLNETHSMVIVASAFDASSQRIVRYLSERHDIAINTAFFSVFEDEGRTLLATDWLLDQAEVAERSEARVQAPWSGLWYVNVGEGSNRAWEDMRRLGFISAGGGDWYSGPLQRLQIGDPIFAYQKQAGYVGYGKVASTAVMARDFETRQGPLLDQALVQPNLAHDRDDPKRSEYVVGVEWLRTIPLPEAKWAEGLFANQNIVCKLRDPKTVDFLKEQFGVVID
ncbi:endonuclease NucS domain-containing protein [Ensifer sp. P24N7]|uniref:endonuclease NucS domain-containing protein n=1 Tax=Sinorhizobium sp. P24N7 TaxID=3348358 RepID=UPI0035F3ECAA